MSSLTNSRLAMGALLFLSVVPLGLFFAGTAVEEVRQQPKALSETLTTTPESAERHSIPQDPNVLERAESTADRKTVVRVRSTSSPGDERSIVETLRELQLSNPHESLRLSRISRARFPEGPTVPERSWFEARALVELGRFAEARNLTAWMIAHHPESPFTADLQRHLLSHPFGLPPR